jgi:hypothetical protein
MGAGPASSNGGGGSPNQQAKDKAAKDKAAQDAKDKAAKDKAQKKIKKKHLEIITPIKQVERLVSQLNIQKLENKILKKKKKKHFKNKVLIIQEEVLKIHFHQLLKFLDQVYLNHYKKMQ